MHTARHGYTDGLATLDGSSTQVLDPKQERKLLGELADCKQTLAEAPTKLPGAPPPSQDGPPALSRYLAHLDAGAGPAQVGMGVVWRRYSELRSKLALANFGLVAHMAKRYRGRGIARADLIQEGFCGLLEAIDRFDVSNQNQLATYAMWWIRQRMQCAVAAEAYPVRLNPRCLRKLAEDLRRRERTTRDVERIPEFAVEPIPKAILDLWAVTRPTVCLDEARQGESPMSQSIADPHGDATGEVDTRESLEKLMGSLLPRERQVLYLRFGLEGQGQHSLSQAGKLLGVSRERVRQIQDRALEKLRAMV
jgi:RNA polymerase primary sigma factor